MNVSAADILTVATYLFGSYDPKESFSAIGSRIVAARPSDWKRLMRAAVTLRGDGVVHDYAAQAELLRAALAA